MPAGICILAGCAGAGVKEQTVLNDVHSRINQTEVDSVVYPKNAGEVARAVSNAKNLGKSVSISGGRHAMGGQQFGAGTVHISTAEMNDVLSFDRARGIIRVEAGIDWLELADYLKNAQAGEPAPWGFTQKQTGADRLSIGGALSANAHGRGVKFKPIVQDVEAFKLVNANGELLTVSRTENGELFRLAIGGYGLFGVITTVDLRLRPRIKVERVVEVIPIGELPAKARARIEEGHLYGDFQYKTDQQSDDFMKVGVFSTYKPVPMNTPIPEGQGHLSPDGWRKMLTFAHTDKKKAFEFYSKYYLETNGQVYWSDTHQMNYYDDQYVEYLRTVLPGYDNSSLMITEIYVPRDSVTQFIENVTEDARQFGYDIIYGTMRLIEKDDETFLPWAKSNYACVIFNLRIEHSESGIEKAKADFRRLIDRGLELGGSYFLTYHRWARRDQVLAAYPQFVEFLKLKLKHDPAERFQSEWYRHYKQMFQSELGGENVIK